jgi:hypothetical protein
VLAGTAAAAPLTLQVVNERGVEPASFLNRSSGTSLTSGQGLPFSMWRRENRLP